jgi:hypothetical protein
MAAVVNGTSVLEFYAAGLLFGTNDSYTIGSSARNAKEIYVARAIMGSKTKALTEGVATAIVTVAVPENDFTQFRIRWAVFAEDATNQQLRVGENVFGCVNEAGTEVCVSASPFADIDNTPTGTLACTETYAAGTDAVDFTLDCTSSLTQTTLDAYYRLDMLNPQTVTPQ